MRALLSTIGSRGDIQPMIGLALQMGRLGAVATVVMRTRGWQ
jgi:UDP:flavonoid glycosyltransferase YjiC (YdhE family)